MKTTFTIFALCLWWGVCQGQYKQPFVDKFGRPTTFGVYSLSSKIPVFLTVDQHTKSVDPSNALPNDPLGNWVLLEEAQEISVTVRVRKDSLSYYRYSVFENDTTIVRQNAKLELVDFVFNERSDFPGELSMKLKLPNVVNKKLTIKLYRLPEESRVTTVVIYNKPLLQAVSQGIFLRSHGKEVNVDTKYEVTELKNGIRFVGEQANGIYVPMQKTDLDFVYQLMLKKKIGDQYEIVYTSNNWTYNTVGANPVNIIPASYFLAPGEYQLSIVPQIESNNKLRSMEEKSLTRSFTVIPPPIVYSIQEVIIGIIVLLLATALVIYLIRKNARRKLLTAKLQTAAAESELENVRSRLNPHFVFNALGGIQNLINKNQIAPANVYLSRFARLTRHILDNDAKISIKDEIDLLEDYVAMEQLRFPFKYSIHLADECIGPTNPYCVDSLSDR